MATKTKSQSKSRTTSRKKTSTKSTSGSTNPVAEGISLGDLLKQDESFIDPVGQPAHVKNPEGKVVDGFVTELNERDKNGVPQNAVFQSRNDLARFTCKPSDITLGYVTGR